MLSLVGSLVDEDSVEGVSPMLHDWLEVRRKSLMEVGRLHQIQVLGRGTKILHQGLHGDAGDEDKPIDFQIILRKG